MKRLLIALIFVNLLGAKTIKITFDDESGFGPSKHFSSIVGYWHLGKDGDNVVYCVDGRKWARGTLAKGVAEKAKALYGERYAEFLDNVKAYRYFPLSIFKELDNFKNGKITVRFKTISGKIDQAAGIAFDIKKNGDYLVVRANPLENNLVLFQLKNGRRRPVQWIRRVKTLPHVWHTLTVVIKGQRIQGFLDGKKYVDFKARSPISGKIGLWSKADSYVYFDDFTVETEEGK